jgi:hypothetical protein
VNDTIRQDDGVFTRALQITPGYRYRHNSERAGMKFRFWLSGPAGAVQFLMLTDWEPGQRQITPNAASYPMAADLGWHWRTPMYPGQALFANECDVLGAPCYYDGSGLQAEPVLAGFLRDGLPAVWTYLERSYLHYSAKEVTT